MFYANKLVKKIENFYKTVEEYAGIRTHDLSIMSRTTCPNRISQRQEMLIKNRFYANRLVKIEKIL